MLFEVEGNEAIVVVENSSLFVYRLVKMVKCTITSWVKRSSFFIIVVSIYVKYNELSQYLQKFSIIQLMLSGKMVYFFKKYIVFHR